MRALSRIQETRMHYNMHDITTGHVNLRNTPVGSHNISIAAIRAATGCDKIGHLPAILRFLEPSQTIARWNVLSFDFYCCDGNFRNSTDNLEAHITRGGI